LADRPEVRLVHDDGRAYLTRTPDRFDVIQMSLVDTWAATGAGAFTLSENGLYTLEAWRMFLDRLRPGGILSVSRWFSPGNLSETSRLISLAVAATLDRGAPTATDRLILTARGRVATLLVSTEPFSSADRDELQRVADTNEFEVLVSPWLTGNETGTRLSRIAHSRTPSELQRATADATFDFRPPTDERPYYFNMLKPSAFVRAFSMARGGILWGNLRATMTLLILLGVAVLLVTAIIIWPLVRSRRPAASSRLFATTLVYFGMIGFGYMLIQIALLQRFSVYLGHPTYTLAIILFSMLLFTGVGSFLSERLHGTGRLGFIWIPVLIAVLLGVTILLIPVAITQTVTRSLPFRSGVVLALTGPLSLLLGVCFPIGARLSSRAPALLAWAWGTNGACGVLASIVAVAISMWVGIDANLWLAAALYLALTLPLVIMGRV
jgi:hypothetical protein